MKTQISAGGIVVRRIGGEWYVLLLQDKNDTWTFPKGKVEAGENLEAAARREIQEEVGLKALTMRRTLAIIRYMYQRSGLISKTVHYFIFESKGNEQVINQTEEGIHNARWVAIPEAILVIGYKKTNRPLLVQTKEFLSSYARK